MDYEEFLNLVQQYAGLDTQEEALQITRATLETLGERIYRSARGDIASQLPGELKPLLSARVSPETSRQQVDRFSLEEFYNRVSARADVGYPRAVSRSRAVMSVLKEAISGGEWEDLRSELPAEYSDLLG